MNSETRRYTRSHAYRQTQRHNADKGMREREKEGEGERENEERDRQTERKKKERETDRQTNKQKHKRTGRHTKTNNTRLNNKKSGIGSDDFSLLFTPRLR